MFHFHMSLLLTELQVYADVITLILPGPPGLSDADKTVPGYLCRSILCKRPDSEVAVVTTDKGPLSTCQSPSKTGVQWICHNLSNIFNTR